MEDISKYVREECSVVDDNLIKLGTGQLSREDYLQVKKLFESRGGKWKSGKIFGFVFPGNARIVFDSIVSGDVSNKKNEFNLFETPDSLAEKMIKTFRRGCLNSNKRFLEPSAGRGNLIHKVLAHCPGARFDAYEINPDCWPALEKMSSVQLFKTDFLDAPEDVLYDIIIANPPFSNNRDVRHVMKMLKLLAPDGHLVTIMSKHWLTSDEKVCKEFWDILSSLTYSIESIEKGTFKESGTDVETVMLSIVK